MKVKYEVVAVTGKYTNSAGEEKKRYLKCGVVMEGDKGLSLKLEAVPVGSDGWFYLFEPKAKDDAPRQQTRSNGGGSNKSGDLDDGDIPFFPHERGQVV